MKFKFGTTSYIYPAEICENIKKLACFEIIKTIQILFFETEDSAELPNPFDTEKILNLKKKIGLEYAVHLPLNINLSEKCSEKKLDSLIKIIEIGKIIGSEIFVIHFDLPAILNKKKFYNELSDEIKNQFYSNVSKNLEYILKKTSIQSSIAAENIYYHPKFLKYFVERFKIGICADFGHLFKYNLDITCLTELAEHIKLVHLHDINFLNEDHNALSNKKRITSVFDFLTEHNYSGNIIIELFNERKFIDSINFLDSCISEF